jgi:metal-dependent amidase/aminoacylase/carboxypeptidase family protein
MNYEGFVPVTWNNPALASRIAVLLTGVPGVKKIITDAKPKMGSEDFSFYSRLVPCCYFFVGCAKGGHFHHSPYFDIDENCLEIAVRAIVQILANLAG